MVTTIAILAPSSVPFQSGGAEKLWWGLRRALDDFSGANVELIKLPSRENSFSEIVDSYRAFSQLDLSHFDMLITTKYPAWIASHHNHVCYMQHTLRGLYDTYRFTRLPEKLAHIPAALDPLMALVRKPRPQREDLAQFFELCQAALANRSLPRELFAFPGPLIREVVHFLDRVALAPGQIKTWLAISETVARRKDYFPPEAQITVLHHPPDLERFSCREGSYFFTASRLNSTKRLSLIIDAMKLVPGNTELRIAGTGPDLEFLKARAAADPRIHFLGRVTDSELSDLYAGAIAVPFTPLDEDYGLITIEAMKSGKPVITVSDSGGVCEMVRHEATGLITDSTPAAIARAMTRLDSDRAYAQKLGSAARESVSRITWEQTARKLMACAAGESVCRKKILVLAPFQAAANGAGGERRMWHICMDLAREYSVRFIAFGSKILAAKSQRQVLPNFHETLLPWPATALACSERLYAETGLSSDDIALLRHARDSVALREALAEEGQDAVCAVLAHPWLYDAFAAALPDLPCVYDAHNVESELKLAIYGSGQIASETEALERRLCQNAVAVFACSPEDGRKFSAFGPSSLHVLLPGCEKPQIQEKAPLRRRLAYPDARLALFIASGHKPNLDAAFAILEIAKALPELEFLLAGTVSTQAEIRAARKPANVHLLGKVSEQSKNVLLNAADFGLNPVETGSGVNLKSLEYLAWGLPFVSTPCGMRGIEGEFSPLATICELADFPARLRELASALPDPEAVGRVRSGFLEKWSWSEVLKPLRPGLAQALGNTGPCVC